MFQHQSLASLLGWLSFSCWIFVYSPQIYENYVNQSGEGISIFFILIWMIGDLANLFGSWKQNLLPTMIVLALYYFLCDLTILSQIFYYRRLARIKKSNRLREIIPESTENDALLASDINTLPPLSNKIKSWRREIITYITAASSILIIGVACWLISEGRFNFYGTPNVPIEDPIEVWDSTAQIVGWISAAAYLGSRIPQIFKNQQTKCKGLSMLFFLVGITGNLTYVGSILCTSLEPAHIWINLSWLVGSGGTVFLDLIVLYQFWFYRHDRLALSGSVTLP
ncbi:hypothetical protein CROQUDRAFT_660906 [Cronartium quercuum f. sp. fusiforme G11]|uniref:PQ-loop-domain-containing protein n=1 Tax=Cronartium quercuum f. sp. fusiforme G11 TaxID=708437 RepID=A0A9P6NGJ2_9BASI|nr:hypothetical protein CROQUDRAFT_660906 [Cronartium quercuum f. sp. fusiforme G11]